MNFKAFFDDLRPNVNLTLANVDGLQKIILYGQKRGTQVNRLAYVCATAFWETGQSCQPVEEGYYLGSPAKVRAFQRRLRYYPWFGRGLIQTTWKRNYIEIAKLIGLPADAFTKDPDKLLEWEYALPALFVGMETGIYTGKDLDDYIDELDEAAPQDYREYLNARRIVNGTDKAHKIATLALYFEQALKAGGYGPKAPVSSPVSEPVRSSEPATPAPAPAPAPAPVAPTPAPVVVKKPLRIWKWLAIIVMALAMGAAVYLWRLFK